MIKVKNGVKYYPVSEYIVFNLESLHCKVLNEIDEAREAGDWEKESSLQATVDELEQLMGHSYLSGKDYARAKELAVYREILRDQICAEARAERA